jgi:chromate reductase
MKTIMAISGSLRTQSKNSIILQKLKVHYKETLNIEIFEGLSDLPHFNPDIEFQNIASVKSFRAKLKAADWVMISTPEYAHGIPGSLKNALDWVVGSGELIDKKVVLLFSSSSNAQFVQEQLIEVITTMSGSINREHCLKISGADLSPEILSVMEKTICLLL